MRALLVILVMASFIPIPVEAIDKRAWPHATGLDAERRYKKTNDKRVEKTAEEGMGLGGPVLPGGKQRQHAFDSLDSMISELIDLLDKCGKGNAKDEALYKKRYEALKKRLEIEQNRLKKEQSDPAFGEKAKADKAKEVNRLKRNIGRLEGLFKDLPKPGKCPKKDTSRSSRDSHGGIESSGGEKKSYGY